MKSPMHEQHHEETLPRELAEMTEWRQAAPSPGLWERALDQRVQKSAKRWFQLDRSLTWSILSWPAEKWVADERPFQEVRIRIEKVCLTEKNVTAMVLRYESEAKKNPRQPLAVFGWAFAVYIPFCCFSTRKVIT